jgi:hypothetical protein
VGLKPYSGASLVGTLSVDACSRVDLFTGLAAEEQVAENWLSAEC